MKFYQYATGRAREKGYGFSVQTEGISFNNSTFRTQRDLSRMPQDSMVYELHRIDQQHTALVMTRVDSFGSSNYCYTHALITEQAAEPASLMQLLRPESFLNSDEFLALEDAKERGEELGRLEMELQQTSPASLPDNLRTDVLHRFLGYLWNVCWQRRLGAETLRPAVLVMPHDMTLPQMIHFYADCILPLLPGELRAQASVVFGADPRYFGQFPQTTACYVLQEPSYEVMPMFDLERGVTVSNSDYTNVLVYELGKGLDMGLDGELAKWTLTKAHRQLLPKMPRYSVEDFTLAYRFQHLDMLWEQSSKSMALYQRHILGRYRELREILRARYASADARLVLGAAEKMAFRYWQSVSGREETPPELYFDLAHKALTTPDEELWESYLTALGQPCQLTGGEMEEDVLLCRGRWKRADLPGGLEGLNRERFAVLMAKRLNASGDARLALAVLRELNKETLKSEELRTCIAQILRQELNSLPQAEVNEILDWTMWQQKDKNGLLQALVEEKAVNSPSGENLLLLCEVLQKHRYPEGVRPLVRCAEQFRMNPREAERLADVLVSYAEQAKGETGQAVLALFENQPNEQTMRRLLQQLYHFSYHRAAAPTWVQVEDGIINQALSAELNEVKTARRLLEVGDEWRIMMSKEYHRDWNEVPATNPQAEKVVRNACSRVIRAGMITELHALMTGARFDWFGKIVSDEAGSYTRENLDALISDERNFPAMPRLTEMAALPGSTLGDDSRIRVIALLNAPRSSVENPFELLRELNGVLTMQPGAGIMSYIRRWGMELQADTLEWEMARYLLAFWGDPLAGWSAFLRERGWTPRPGASPWKGDLYPMQALRHVCGRLVRADANNAWRETLRRFVTNDPAWANYIRHMENKREHRSFVRDDSAPTPDLREWLGLK